MIHLCLDRIGLWRPALGPCAVDCLLHLTPCVFDRIAWQREPIGQGVDLCVGQTTADVRSNQPHHVVMPILAGQDLGLCHCSVHGLLAEVDLHACAGRAAALRGRKGPHHPLERHRISVAAEFRAHRDHLLDVTTALLVFVRVADCASDTHDPRRVDHHRISAEAGRDAGLHLAPSVEVDARLFQPPVGMAPNVRRRACLDRHGEFRAGE